MAKTKRGRPPKPPLMAEEKPAQKPKKAHRVYTDADRGASLAMFDFYGGETNKGAREYTAKMLKIPRKTLSDWIDGRGKTVTEVVQDVRAAVKIDMVETVEATYKDALSNVRRAAEVAAEAGKVKEIVVSAAILQDKRADLLGLTVRRYSPDILAGGPASRTADDPVAGAPAEPVSPAAQYEPVIAKIISDGEKEGKTITRDQAIEAISALKPEAGRVLNLVPAATKTG